MAITKSECLTFLFFFISIDVVLYVGPNQQCFGWFDVSLYIVDWRCTRSTRQRTLDSAALSRSDRPRRQRRVMTVGQQERVERAAEDRPDTASVRRGVIR